MTPGSWRVAAILFAAVSVSLLVPASARAQDEEAAREIMRRALRDSRSTDEVISVTMSLVDAGGRVRQREATFYSKMVTADTSARLIRFHSPPEFSRSGILTIERRDGDADQWIYLPAYHASRRVPTANRGHTWMGTDFTYEDIHDARTERYAYRTVGTDRIDGVDCTLIEAVPTDRTLADESAYGATVSCVEVEQAVILRIVYLDREGERIKVLENSGLRRYGDYLRWDRSEMTDLQRNHTTTLEVTDRKVDDGLDDDYFRVRYLERGR